jgi:hypothetical protein
MTIRTFILLLSAVQMSLRERRAQRPARSNPLFYGIFQLERGLPLWGAGLPNIGGALLVNIPGAVGVKIDRSPLNYPVKLLIALPTGFRTTLTRTAWRVLRHPGEKKRFLLVDPSYSFGARLVEMTSTCHFEPSTGHGEGACGKFPRIRSMRSQSGNVPCEPGCDQSTESLSGVPPEDAGTNRVDIDGGKLSCSGGGRCGWAIQPGAPSPSNYILCPFPTNSMKAGVMCGSNWMPS